MRVEKIERGVVHKRQWEQGDKLIMNRVPHVRRIDMHEAMVAALRTRYHSLLL